MASYTEALLKSQNFDLYERSRMDIVAHCRHGYGCEEAKWPNVLHFKVRENDREMREAEWILLRTADADKRAPLQLMPRLFRSGQKESKRGGGDLVSEGSTQGVSDDFHYEVGKYN